MKAFINFTSDVVYWLVVIILVLPMTILDLFTLIEYWYKEKRSV